MAEAKKPLGQLLTEQGLIDTTQLEQALAQQAINGGRLGTLLIEQRRVAAGDVSRCLARQHSVPEATIAQFEAIRSEALSHLLPQLCAQHVLLPLAINDGVLTLAMRDPTLDLAMLPWPADRLERRVAPEVRLFYYLELCLGVLRQPRYADIDDDLIVADRLSPLQGQPPQTPASADEDLVVFEPPNLSALAGNPSGSLPGPTVPSLSVGPAVPMAKPLNTLGIPIAKPTPAATTQPPLALEEPVEAPVPHDSGGDELEFDVHSGVSGYSDAAPDFDLELEAAGSLVVDFTERQLDPADDAAELDLDFAAAGRPMPPADAGDDAALWGTASAGLGQIVDIESPLEVTRAGATAPDVPTKTLPAPAVDLDLETADDGFPAASRGDGASALDIDFSDTGVNIAVSLPAVSSDDIPILLDDDPDEKK